MGNKGQACGRSGWWAGGVMEGLDLGRYEGVDVMTTEAS